MSAIEALPVQLDNGIFRHVLESMMLMVQLWVRGIK